MTLLIYTIGTFIYTQCFSQTQDQPIYIKSTKQVMSCSMLEINMVVISEDQYSILSSIAYCRVIFLSLQLFPTPADISLIHINGGFCNGNEARVLFNQNGRRRGSVCARFCQTFRLGFYLQCLENYRGSKLKF